ncbi:hypothetical protein MAUB_34240 [Mycolicibacterium aubagnense]|uniref:Uncharacterized protein n=1 Tax=Mycolicibacterium aubagnense TaxID=319707 RepID=A0ABM7IFT8_9MYCO|nr:hypothetical protein MAUB_34240 [Mycolicibacterium aubagnense]
MAPSSWTTSTGIATAVTAEPNELIAAAVQYRTNEERGAEARASPIDPLSHAISRRERSPPEGREVLEPNHPVLFVKKWDESVLISIRAEQSRACAQEWHDQ